MIVRIADTFTKALGRLAADEQKQAKITAFDLQQDPSGASKAFHRVERSRDTNFWSARVSQDLRIIVHKQGDALLLAYVDHHDRAYAWAERKRLETHPRTGAAQFVEVSVVAEPAPVAPIIVQPKPTAPKPAPQPARYPFQGLTDDQLLDVGVPADWLEPVRATIEDGLFELLEKLPAEAAEALLDHATGGRLDDHIAPQLAGDPFAHPDALRRFRLVENLDELKAALDAPFERWMIFLHPAQRATVERQWNGAARVTGSAGTGKTIVALHRAAHLARSQPDAMVLLTTFSKQLAKALSGRCDLLLAAEPDVRARVSVKAINQAALEIHAIRFGPSNMATSSQIRAAIIDAQKQGLGAALSGDFLVEEWTELVDAWQVADRTAYADVPRLGRRTRLGAQQREAAWAVFDYVRQRLAARKLTTWPTIFTQISALRDPPFTHVVVDEAQDLSVAQVRWLASLAARRADAVFLAGDTGQRIFNLPFSWLRLGLDVRGRSVCLKVNYRTSHQIRLAADRLLPAAIADVDGIEDGRTGTVSLFDGPTPQVFIAEDEAAEGDTVASYLSARLSEKVEPCEMCVLVRSENQLGRARASVKKAGLDPYAEDGVRVLTMHDAKGLEFRVVAVMAVDEEVLPASDRIAAIGDPAELETVYETERHLLYVACTRARDHLMVSAVDPGSEFLGDLKL
ncbi:MAG: 3'-5' exonuclease [Sandarakinorhabdus sp.]